MERQQGFILLFVIVTDCIIRYIRRAGASAIASHKTLCKSHTKRGDPILPHPVEKPAKKTSAESLVTATAWNSSTTKTDCSVRTLTDEEVVIFQYRRSTKECRQMRAALDLKEDANTKQVCTEPGTIFDNFAWVQMKRLLPNYRGYDKLFL